ncbi:Titin [Salix suchowensis]|nr:Titin [Salix suchowensis]
MDLEEWELLPHEGLVEFHGDGEKKNFGASRRGSSSPKSMFNTNYFMCPSSPPKHSRVVRNQLVPVPIQLEPATATGKDVPEDHVISKKEVISVVPIDLCTAVPSVILPGVKEADQDSVSQVFFKKMKENEFVDMKLDSPKSSSTKGGFVPPQIDAGATFNFEDQSDHQGYTGDQELDATKISSPRIKITGKESGTTGEVGWEENSGGLNLWKLSLTGIGAICSFGVAAATICIFIFGSHQRNKQQQQNQKLRFQIYTDDKGIERVVHCATKLNGAISTGRGVPIARAHITYGGYHDCL